MRLKHARLLQHFWLVLACTGFGSVFLFATGNPFSGSHSADTGVYRYVNITRSKLLVFRSRVEHRISFGSGLSNRGKKPLKLGAIRRGSAAENSTASAMVQSIEIAIVCAELECSCSNEPEASMNSIIKLTLPCCGRKLSWQIIMSPDREGWPTMDFIFDDESFQPLLSNNPLTPLIKAALLSQQRDPRTTLNLKPQVASLLDILSMLLQAYREHQLDRLSTVGASHPRLQFELSTLPHCTGLQLMYIETREGEPSKACFSIPLEDLDMGQLVEHQEVSTSGALEDYDKALRPAHPFRLNATFKLIASNLEPELHLQAPAHASTWLPKFVLPVWTSNMCLMEYVPLLVAKLQTELDALTRSLHVKQQLFECLANALGAPLEHNLVGATVMYSLMYDGLPVLLHVDASSARFPDEQPLLTCTNVRLLGSGPDGSCSYRDYPWSPRWHPEEQAARIHNFLKANLSSFLRLPTPGGQPQGP